ncbi:MAG: SIMPL domain-containing protein [archaeon]
MKMDNSVVITGMIVGAILVVALLGFYVFSEGVSEQTVVSNGIAEVKVVPDLVSVYFSVETSGGSAKVAKDANAEIVDAVVTALVKEGFAREDIVTENFNVYEDFDWTSGQRISKGFKATHSIKVELSTDGEIGDVIDAGIDSGAMLSYINFELSRELENRYKAEALKLAAQDARIKAEAIAGGLGAKLGDVVSTSSSDFDYYPWLAYDSASVGGESVRGAKVETEIQVGERTIQGRVSVTYELK